MGRAGVIESAKRRIRSKIPKDLDLSTWKADSKVDLGKILKMRLEQCLSISDIAKIVGVSKQAISQRLIAFDKYLADPEALRAYQENRGKLLNVVESKMVDSLLDDEKIKAASLNNVAYAFTQIHNARRLEEGKSTSNQSVMVSNSDLDQQILDLETKLMSTPDP